MLYKTPSDYNKTIRLKVDKRRGYRYFCDQFHPLSSAGKVYYHRHVASIKVGRWLTKDEAVHHKDEDKTNNHPDNLEILSNSEHIALHHKERGHILKSEKVCPKCGASFVGTEKVYCSRRCVALSQPGKIDMEKHDSEKLKQLVWSMPIRDAAKQVGVSDVALAKACRRLSVPMPGRGYWIRKDQRAT